MQPLRTLHQRFSVPYEYPVHFTVNAFAIENPILLDVLQARGGDRVLVVIDAGVVDADATLLSRVHSFFASHASYVQLVCPPLVVAGGESAKNDDEVCRTIQTAIHAFGICRQSFVVAIGGGALLDLAGYAAATAHRGVRLVRMPSTVLSQDDSGVGVKNSVNAFGKKNFLGTFAPPFAVINDFAFLRNLPQRDWISGLSEAVKVALLKDADFFNLIEQNADELAARSDEAMQAVVHRSAELHLLHIGTGGDPFETRSSRPLDFGHWAAHKLEPLTDFALRHGEAVAIGVALDATYSWKTGLLPEREWSRILNVLEALGLPIAVPDSVTRLAPAEAPSALLHGLQEFREHLGGELTITLLRGIGHPVEVHEMDHSVVLECVELLRSRALTNSLGDPVEMRA